MNRQQRFLIMAGFVMAFILAVMPAALSRAEEPAKPMQSHDFTDVPVAGQEFMEPFINAFYHQGITGGCSASPLQYCPTNPVTRGSMAVFMGRALGYVDAETDGVNARAYFKQLTEDSNYHGVVGVSIDGRGVYGRSDNAYGVYALSGTQTALYARGEANGADQVADQLYDIQLGGTLGEIYAPWWNLVTDASFHIRLDANNNASSAFGIYNGTGVVVFALDEDGDMSALGTKSAIVDTVSHGTRLLYAVESPEVWFEDAGRGELVDGEAVIAFEDIFAETVNLNEDYQVFLTPIDGWADLYVTNMTATSFTVRSADGSDVEFSYRIMAKRLGYEDVRLEEVED